MTQGAVTAREAVVAAWAWWGTLIAVPIVVAGLGAWVLGPLEGVSTQLRGTVFAVAAGLWVLGAGPAAFVLRSHCFRAAWQGRGVEPARYLRGVLTAWAAWEVGALLSVVGCLASGAWLPCALPGVLALMALVALPPSGRAVAAVA